MKGKSLRVALLGFGTVGSSVVRILEKRADLVDCIQLTHIFNRNIEQKRADWVSKSVIWTDDIEEVLSSRPDVVVELVGGLDPVQEWTCRALMQGASVITANKALLADKGPELFRLANKSNTRLLFEASVGGGIPVIRGIREGLLGDKITGIAGILNGTCNYVLSQMSATRSPMDVVLTEAQRLGFSESDPSADLDGFDAVAKIVLLSGVAFQKHLQQREISPQSIRRVAAIDFDYARELGCTIRQLAIVKRQEDGFSASVGPSLVPRNSGFGRNNNANNLITVIGAHGGETSFSGAGAGGSPTAVSVVSDLLALAHFEQVFYEEEWTLGQIVPSLPQKYYLRFVVKDRPGIVATVASVFSAQAINIDTVIQLPGYQKDNLPFVITLEACKGDTLRDAMASISREDFHAEAPLVLPIWDESSI